MVNTSWMKEFKVHTTKIMEKYQIPAYEIALAKDGEIFYEEGFGYRDFDKKTPPDENTVFGIGSVSKSFTCVAIMQLQEAGKLNVHDSVCEYLPEFKLLNGETKDITIHHLMTHSSGMPPLRSLYLAMKDSMEKDPSLAEKKKEQPAEAEGKQLDTYEELMDFIAKQDAVILGKPGTQFSYSNDGYALLGAIIERVSGQKYEEYVKDNIFKPLEMKNTFFYIEEVEANDNVAVLYTSKEEDGETSVSQSPEWWDAPSMRAAGFIKSTAKDMLQYADIFRNGGKYKDARILTAESVQQMMEPHIQCEPKRFYGYGLMITPDYYGHKMVEHGGALKGVAAQMNILPELGITGVSFTNLAGVPSTYLLNCAFNGVLEQPLTGSHLKMNASQMDEAFAQDYLGTFASQEGMTGSIIWEEGKLMLTAEGFPKTELSCVEKDIFTLKIREANSFARFIRDENGDIDRLAFGFRQLAKVKQESGTKVG